MIVQGAASLQGYVQRFKCMPNDLLIHYGSGCRVEPLALF